MFCIVRLDGSSSSIRVFLEEWWTGLVLLAVVVLLFAVIAPRIFRHRRGSGNPPDGSSGYYGGFRGGDSGPGDGND